jgi:hypothetical protein
MLSKINPECFVKESLDGSKLETLSEFFGVWHQEKRKIDGTNYGSPFKLKKEIIICTKGDTTTKVNKFFDLPRVKTYWDESLVLTPSILGLTENQILAYKNFLFENKNLVDEPVLIVRQKRTRDRFCRVVLPGEPLPAIPLQGKSSVAWNVYEPLIQKTYDVVWENQLKLNSDNPQSSIRTPIKEILSKRVPDRFYLELSNYLNNN